MWEGIVWDVSRWPVGLVMIKNTLAFFIRCPLTHTCAHTCSLLLASCCSFFSWVAFEIILVMSWMEFSIKQALAGWCIVCTDYRMWFSVWSQRHFNGRLVDVGWENPHSRPNDDEDYTKARRFQLALSLQTVPTGGVWQWHMSKHKHTSESAQTNAAKQAETHSNTSIKI